jgi:lipoprotein-anchoring transpeptidase ErfK/SrfK
MTSTVEAPVERPSDPPEKPRRWLFRSLVAAGVLAVLLVGAAFWLYQYDRSHRTELLPGVTIADLDAGGREAAEVVEELEGRIPAVGSETIRVVAGPKEARLTLSQMGLHTDAARAVSRARADARDMGVARRVWHRLLDKPVHRSYPVRLTVERLAVRQALAGLGKDVEQAPRNADIDTSTGFVTITPAVEGRSLDLDRATEDVFRLATRKANGEPSAGEVVNAPLVMKKPEITGYADVLLVRTGENKLYHYENGRLARTFVVATGTARYPTPKGRFTITLKRRNPTWVNPDPKGWGASLPPRIGPGPGNPLGTRAMNLSAPGIRIHGTSNVASLGTNASHGCIRMSIAESESLFEMVESGTPVVIIQGPTPPKPPPQAPVSVFGNPNAPIDLEAG